MNSTAIAQAGHALHRAKNCIAVIEQPISGDGSPDHSQKIEAWHDFLTQIGRFYNKVFAAVDRGSEKGWADKKKYERRTDDLLSYLYQARNALEHGTKIGEIVKTFPEPIVVNFAHPKSGKILTSISMKPVWYLCAPVANYGVEYEVPKRHRGSDLNQQTLGYIGASAIPYLEEMLEEARAFLS